MARSWSISDDGVIVLDSDEEPSDPPRVTGTAPPPVLGPPTSLLPSLASSEAQDPRAAAPSSPKRESTWDTEGLFQKLTALCEARIGKDKDGKAVLVILHKRYKKASKAYRRSRDFHDLLEAMCSKIATNDGQMFVYIKEVVGELKAYQELKTETKPLPFPVTQLPTTSDKRSPSIQSGVTDHGQYQHSKVEFLEVEPMVHTVSMAYSSMEVVPVSNGQLCNTTDDTSRQNSATRPRSPTGVPDQVMLHRENQEGSDYSSAQVAELENLLGKYSRAIQRHEEKEMGLDELQSAASNYIIVSKLKARATKIFKQLCNMKGRSHLTGRPVEKKFKYSGTRYAEINKKVQSFINKPGSWEERMPDYHDIHRIVCACNARYNLGFSKTLVLEVAKEVFTDVGNLLQQQRHDDFVSTFGTHLTDSFRPSDDPALFDRELKDRLDANRAEGRSRLDEVINRYAYLEREEMENERTKEGAACKKRRVHCSGVQGSNGITNVGQSSRDCLETGDSCAASSSAGGSTHVDSKQQNSTRFKAAEPNGSAPSTAAASSGSSNGCTAGHSAAGMQGGVSVPTEDGVPAIRPSLLGGGDDVVGCASPSKVPPRTGS